MPSCGNPEKSAGLRFSLIFPTAAPTNAPFICHRQRSRLLPGTRVPRFKNFTQRQKIQAPQSDACISWQGQKDLNPRHAVLERCVKLKKVLYHQRFQSHIKGKNKISIS